MADLCLFRRWLRRRRCMHHDWRTGQTWIKTALADLGRTKLIWCDRCWKDF